MPSVVATTLCAVASALHSDAAAAFLKQLGLKLFMGFLLARANRLRVTMPEPLLEVATWHSQAAD